MTNFWRRIAIREDLSKASVLNPITTLLIVDCVTGSAASACWINPYLASV
jgi:hypothetical protein